MRTLIAIATAALLAGCASSGIESNASVASSAVRIETPMGLGSGVYIGNGIVLTAAHVVADAPSALVNGSLSGPPLVTLRSSDGDVQQGEVLWINREYDIAAVRPSNARRFGAANLACRAPKVGEPLTAEGNPFGLSFITMHGFVAAAPTEYAPKWKSAFITDISMASGMSGGPSYDKSGEVIGINVGVVDPHGGAQGATSGFAFVVPGSAVCGLLGRV
jgi:S1-C subfamily serine protease